MQLLRRLQELGLATLDMGSLFGFTLGHLSAMLQPGMSAQLLAVSRASEHVDWAHELTLPALPDPLSGASGKHVFVTGATGFIGPVLVAEVLARYPSDVRVYCLVRGEPSRVVEVP